MDYSGKGGEEEGEEERRKKKEAGGGLTRLLQVWSKEGGREGRREGRRVILAVAHILTLANFLPLPHAVSGCPQQQQQQQRGGREGGREGCDGPGLVPTLPGVVFRYVRRKETGKEGRREGGKEGEREGGSSRRTGFTHAFPLSLLSHLHTHT